MTYYLFSLPILNVHMDLQTPHNKFCYPLGVQDLLVGNHGVGQAYD